MSIAFCRYLTKEIVMRYSHAGPDSRARAMQAADCKQNGHDNGHNLSDQKLREIFEAVRKGEMSFERFYKLLS
jgi:hypothetical protein